MLYMWMKQLQQAFNSSPITRGHPTEHRQCSQGEDLVPAKGDACVSFLFLLKKKREEGASRSDKACCKTRT